MTFRKSARYVALPASLALLVLTGCASGGSGSGPSATSTPDTSNPLKLIQAAYTTTTSAKTARLTVTTDISFPDGTGPGPLTNNVVEDFEHNILDDTMASPSGNEFETRQLGDDLYFKVPDATVNPTFNAPPITKPWEHLRLPQTNQGTLSGLLSGLGGSVTDPKEFVRLLTGASSSVTRIGTDVVRRQLSTHYRLSLDAAKIAELERSDGNCAHATPTSSAPVDVWLDAQGRLTRMKSTQTYTHNDTSALPSADVPTDLPSGLGSDWPTDLPTPLPSLGGSSPSLTMSTTIEAYDYGADIHVSAPPADQVQDVTKDFDRYVKQKLDSTPSPCPTP